MDYLFDRPGQGGRHFSRNYQIIEDNSSIVAMEDNVNLWLPFIRWRLRGGLAVDGLQLGGCTLTA